MTKGESAVRVGNHIVGFRFPIMYDIGRKGSLAELPWMLAEHHRAAIEKAGGDTLEGLAKAGGLDCHALAAAIDEKAYVQGMTDEQAEAILRDHVEYTKALGQAETRHRGIGIAVAVIGAALYLLASVCSYAQLVGGNASIAATQTSANVHLPQPTNPNAGGFPFALLVPAPGAVNEIFYGLGVDNTIAAVAPSLPSVQGSPAVPAGGICVALGANTWVAAVTASGGSATLRITQMTTCPSK